jgi:tetratricopeptide (TPR) repeat protein
VQELFLKATADADRGDARASDEFQRVLALDPQYTAAYVRLARAYAGRALFGIGNASELYPKVRVAATAAIQQDPELAGAHSALAMVRLQQDWDWTQAEVEFKRALELNPSDADTRHDYAHYLMAMSREQESLEQTRRAVELNPLDTVLVACLGWHQLYAGQYDSTIHQGLEGISMRPTLGWAHTVLGWGYEQKGMLPQAVSELQNAVPLWGGAPFALASLAHARAVSGDRPGALAILEKLNDAASRGYVSPYDFAVVHAGLSDLDRAFEWLEKAFDERTAFIIYMKLDPRLRNARNDPRFTNLLRRMKFPAS